MRVPLFPLETPSQTQALAQRLAGGLRPGDVLLLQGPLGAGKTTFARAVIQHLLGKDEAVPSPTYTLAQSYATPRGLVWHVDLYRLKGEAELHTLGLEDILWGTAIALVEWPERLGAFRPSQALRASLEMTPAGGRLLTLEGGERWRDRLEALEGGVHGG